MVGQSFSKIMDYNDTILTDVKKSYPSSYNQFSDPNELLAVKTLKSTCTAFERNTKTVNYSLHDGNNKKDSKMMNNKVGQNYFVSLVKWVKNNYEAETQQQMIIKGVPAKKISSRVVPRYNN